MADYDLVLQIFDEQLLMCENRIKVGICENQIKEEFKVTKEAFYTKIKRLKDGIGSSALKLEFRNNIPETFLTGKIIEGERHTMIVVALVDDTTGEVVDYGPEASANVEVLVLKGGFNNSEADGWTADEFNENIAEDIPGKMPFLAGNVLLKLQRGVCALENIKFRNHTIEVKPTVFRLGTRVVRLSGGVRIKEAKSESFTVKDYRYQYNQKHLIPVLSDKVWRLYNIRKGGKVDNRLKENKIYTVEDFLVHLLRNFDGLKKIVNMATLKWETTVRHAAQACPGGKTYYYENSEKKGIAFNVHGEFQGLYFNNCAVSMSSGNNKADVLKLLASAYKNWDVSVISFDDEISLQRHFTHLGKKVDCSDQRLDCGPEQTGGWRMIGESSHSQSISVSEKMMPIQETCVEHEGLADMEISYEISAQQTFPSHSHSLDEIESWSLEFDSVEELLGGLRDFQKCFIDEVRANRWRRLLTMILSKTSEEGHQISKKRKLFNK